MKDGDYRRELRRSVYEQTGGSAVITLKKAAALAGQKNPRRTVAEGQIYYGLPRTSSGGLYTDDVIDAICRERRRA